MKKSFTLLAALAASLLVFSCKPVVTPDPAPAPDLEPEEVFDPDFAHPGNVESISFTISDIPAEQQSVYIYRKYNTSNKFECYAIYYFYDTTQAHTVTFEDKFVKTDKTYNYRYCFKYKSKDFIDITNGETKNFTPATGLGELEYKEAPEVSYNSATTELSFAKALEFNPDVDTVCTKTDEETGNAFPVYQKAMGMYTQDTWSTSTINYENTSFNLLQTFMYAQGDYDFKSISPALLYNINATYDDENPMIPHIEGALWILGKRYDISDQNVNVHFPQTFGVKNVDNGIEVTFSRKSAFEPAWDNDHIEIYEDGQKLDYYFYIDANNRNLINTNYGTEKKFVFPFTTKGKEYTFTYKPSTDPDKTTIYKKTITAEYTSSLKIDDTKLERNFKNLQVTYTETDTASKTVRLVKVSPDATDIFSGKTESILKHVGIELHIYASTNNEDYGWQGSIKPTKTHTSKLLSDGINLLEDGVVTTYWSINTNQAATFKFKVYIDFSVENEENQCGFFSFDEVESETFTWTPAASE